MKEENRKDNNKGITMIVLVLTIIILLILARDKFSNSSRSKWNNNKGK